jgi:hypothetical protein
VGLAEGDRVLSTGTRTSAPSMGWREAVNSARRSRGELSVRKRQMQDG